MKGPCRVVQKAHNTVCTIAGIPQPTFGGRLGDIYEARGIKWKNSEQDFWSSSRSGDTDGISGVDQVGVGDAVEGHQGCDGGSEADRDLTQGIAGPDGVVSWGRTGFFWHTYGLAGMDQVGVRNVV